MFERDKDLFYRFIWATCLFFFFFFFQAEDGIRDGRVTGVQTCALPISWQASGTHVARSDDGGHTFVQTPISNLFGSDVGDVDIRVGGPTPCSIAQRLR